MDRAERTSTQLGGRLTEAAAQTIVGRDREQAQLRDWFRRGAGPAVVVVSGPGGIGKSALVAGVAATSDQRVLILDGRQIEPTPTGLLQALSAQLGSVVCQTPGQAGAAIDAADIGTLVIDGFERLNLLDGWLRNELLVQLPTDVTTALVGRRPPNQAWRTSPGWRLLMAELVVGPLTHADARELVERRRLPAELTERALSFGRGHPLALELAAEAFARHPTLELPDGPPADAIEELVDVLLDDLDPSERLTVEGASILRRITQPALAAVLTGDHGGIPDLDLPTAWRMLRQLPFTTATPSGLELDAVARSVIAGGLEIRDPARVLQLRRRAAVAALRDAGDGRSWDATADLLFLCRTR